MKTINEACEDFLFHCKFEKNLTKKTILAYSIDLEQFSIYVKQEAGAVNDINAIDKTLLRSYIQHISDKKAKTIKRKLATLKAMFNFLEFEDEITVNPFRKMKIGIKEPITLPKFLNIEEVRKILNVLYKVYYSLSKDSKSYPLEVITRDIAVVEILFATGIRVSELCQLKMCDINLQSGQIIIHGKGRKERIAQVCNQESLDALKRYHELFESRITQNGHFLINRLNKGLSEQSVRFMLRKYANLAGVEKEVTPHIFRHTFATMLLEENVDIRSIQQLLGHSSILTTQIYTHVSNRKQKEILSHRHPRNTILMEELNEG